MATEIQPVKIFIAYAHEDDASRERLRRQLSVLERRGHFHIFWDGLIKPGERWDERLKAELHRADITICPEKPPGRGYSSSRLSCHSRAIGSRRNVSGQLPLSRQY